MGKFFKRAINDGLGKTYLIMACPECQKDITIDQDQAFCPLCFKEIEAANINAWAEYSMYGDNRT